MPRFYLPHDIAYCIDSAVESFDITSDIGVYFHHFNQMPFVDEFDRRDAQQDWEDRNRGFASWLGDLYDNWFFSSAAHPSQQAWCMRVAGMSLTRTLGEKLDHQHNTYVSNALKAGQDPLDQAILDAYLDTDVAMAHSGRLIERLARRVSHAPLGKIEQAFADKETLLDEVEVGEILMANYTRELDILTGHVAPGPNVKVHRLVSKMRKARKKRLKKSSNFASALIGPNDVTMFVGGQEIVTVGERYAFRVGKNDISSMDHGALRIEVWNRENEDRLFNLCWYVPETPIFDQLAALVMAVKVGDEEEIIRIGNASGITEQARNDPSVRTLLGLKETSPIDTVIGRLNDFQFDLPKCFPDEDRMFGYTIGTSEYVRGNPRSYVNFFECAQDRMPFGGFPAALQNHFRTCRPEEIRRIDAGTVSKELVPAEQYLADFPNPRFLAEQITRALDHVVASVDHDEIETTPEEAWADA